MSLLTIVQCVSDLIGLPRPTQVIGNNDQSVVTLLAQINRDGRILSRLRNGWGGGWSVLEKEHVFATVASQEEYALPADFYALIGDTVWDRSTFFEVRGPLSPQQWQAIKSGLAVSPALRHRFRIKRTAGTGKDRKFFLDPVPTQIETVVFEYLTNRWVSDVAGTTFRTGFTADTDESLIPEQLLEMGAVWRFKSSKGLSFAADLAEYEIERDRLIGSDSSPATISLARRGFRLPRANTPETGFGV